MWPSRNCSKRAVVAYRRAQGISQAVNLYHGSSFRPGSHFNPSMAIMEPSDSLSGFCGRSGPDNRRALLPSALVYIRPFDAKPPLMSSSLDAGDLTSDSQLGGRPDDSLFSTTAPEPLLRRVSHSSASSSTHSQQQQEQQDYSLDDPSYSRQEFELDESEIEQQQQQSDFTRDDPSFQTPARHSRPQNGSMAGSHASVASTATAVQDGTARQSLTLREQEKVSMSGYRSLRWTHSTVPQLTHALMMKFRAVAH